MSFVVTIIRHAQTEFNRQYLVHTYSEGSINETGQKQAHHLGNCFQNQKYTRAYSSDITRTQETAKIFFDNSKHKASKLVLDPRLRERTFGEYYEGRHSKELIELAMKSGVSRAAILTFTPDSPGAEPSDDAIQRSVSFFNDLCELRDQSTEDEEVVVFTHGIWMLYLFQHLASKQDEFSLENFDNSKARLPPPNTATTKIRVHELKDGKRRLEFLQMNDESHLGDDALRSSFVRP